MDIRKLSVGPDYKCSMHYIIGQDILEDKYKIHLIKGDASLNTVKIWIINSKQEVLLWKEFTSTMPMSIEYNINF